MRIKIRVPVVLLCSLSCLFHSGEAAESWKAEEVFSEYDLRCLQDQNFRQLKQHVSKFLEGSWCSEDKSNLLMDLVCVNRMQNCVEVGVFTGSSALPIAAALNYVNHGKLYTIDAWSNDEAIRYQEIADPNRDWWSKVDMKAVLRNFHTMLCEWKVKDRCVVLAKPSQEAFYEIPGEIDFLHLDGDYSARGSLLDAQLYVPKVKKDGYILLSNTFFTVNGKQPKKEAFRVLYDACDLIAVIDDENTILFRKR